MICCDAVTCKEKRLIMQHIGAELPQDCNICGRHCSIYNHDYHKCARSSIQDMWNQRKD